MPNLLAQTDHRPWPLPAGPWVMAQTWYDLLFAHWPVAAVELRRLVPAALELDTFEGQAWISVVPFGMRRVRPRLAPPLPWLSYFLELNVRTYVTAEGKLGVYFFSLDAANPVAVAVARRWFYLPYFNARMLLRRDSDGMHYASQRTHRGAPAADFRGRYRPTGQVYRSKRDSLDAWLTERYCLYSIDADGEVFRGEIHHVPWPLQPAEARMEVNTMTTALGLQLPATDPVLHFARRLDVIVWPISRLSR